MLAPRALRSLLGPGLAAALVAGTPAAAATSWRPHVREAVVYAQHRKGEVRFAVRTEHRLWGYRRTDGVHSASVVKALLLVAYLDDPRVRSRPLRAADRRLVDPMIRRSDNAAATRVLGLRRRSAYARPRAAWACAASARPRRVGRRAASTPPTRRASSCTSRPTSSLAIAPPRCACCVPIVPASAGASRACAPGLAAVLQGRLGLGPDLVEHQVALLRVGAYRVAVAVLTSGNPDHAYGAQTLRGVFARLLRGLDARLVLTPT